MRHDPDIGLGPSLFLIAALVIERTLMLAPLAGVLVGIAHRIEDGFRAHRIAAHLFAGCVWVVRFESAIDTCGNTGTRQFLTDNGVAELVARNSNRDRLSFGNERRDHVLAEGACLPCPGCADYWPD